MKKGRVKAKYDPSYVKTVRTFPTGKMFLLCFVILLQLGLVLFAFSYQPRPQDVIHRYDVTVEPQKDGSLDIAYRFVWEALDNFEDLTWVEIGMANENFSVYPDSVSSNVLMYDKYVDYDYVTLRLDFKDAYSSGDVVDFSFKINQKDMLCQNEDGYFYEFVPGWFNVIQVEQYTFRWVRDGAEDLVQRGSLNYGEYCKMTVQYGADAFLGCSTAAYLPFDGEGAHNELPERKVGVMVLCFLGAALLILAEVYIVDCYVSYERGRGFLSGHGYYMHTYGRSNAHYVRARNAHGSRFGGGGGGGCACACACACAGGGRAGCSQKDTTDTQEYAPFGTDTAS